MIATSTKNPQNPAKPLRQRRYKIVKGFGKTMIYALASKQSRQSLVGDTPVLDNAHFAYLQPLPAIGARSTPRPKVKLTAFYQEPRRNMIGYENRFEAAVRRADANLEKLSDI
jgi:hypothetical protein